MDFESEMLSDKNLKQNFRCLHEVQKKKNRKKKLCIFKQEATQKLYLFELNKQKPINIETEIARWLF